VLARELAIALRARVTWIQAALAAVLVGHGFVLAVDLYSATSRAVGDKLLMARELDPLLGVVRPTLGGLYLSASLLGPLVAARILSVEKERRTLGALLLQVGSPPRLLLCKWVAALTAVSLQLVAPVLLLGCWLALGGHLGGAETLTALFGYALYLVFVSVVGIAAAAFCASLAQAATVATVLIAASWAIDASDGFAALAWLGQALGWSVTRHLEPFERGTLHRGAVLWLVSMSAGMLGLALVGLRLESLRRRAGLAALVVVATVAVGIGAHHVRRADDFTEARRGSLPPAAAAALRELPSPIAIEVWMDRDDARRRQLELDLLAKLRIARPDLRVTTPLDERSAAVEGEREEGYGRLMLQVGDARRETYSASRREVVTLLFESQGRSLPDWTQPEYPGHPKVVEGRPRQVLATTAYLILPALLLALGHVCTRSRRRKP
jgi:hypothetical protein